MSKNLGKAQAKTPGKKSTPLVKKIRIKRFKCFEDVTIDFAPITLFTGANSSGKSSALHALLGTMQTSEYPLKFSPNGRYVFMGDYKDIIKDHKEQSSFAIDLTYSINNEDLTIETEWKINRTNKLPDLFRLRVKGLYFELTISRSSNSQQYRLIFDYFKEKNTKHDELKEVQSKLMNVLMKIGKSEEETHADKDKELDRFINFDSNRVEFTSKSIADFETKIQREAGFMHSITFQNARSLVSQIDRRFNYIGSFRYEPEKTRDALVRRTMKVRRDGENYEDQVIAWKEEHAPEFDELVAELHKIKLLQGLKTRRNRGGTYSLDVKTSSTGVFAGIHNVGFGVGQFTPIVVADLQLSANSLLAVSQPEVHLHPAAQASFGDYMASNCRNKSKSYIIETHSEYLLNRLRLLIVKGQLKESDVRVYHFSKKGRSQTAVPVQLHKDGSISGAPKDFFDTYMMDTSAIVLNA